MTIDEAIKCADAISKNTYEICKLSTTGVMEFATLCADALRLAKKMSKKNGITEETEKVCSELKAGDADCGGAVNLDAIRFPNQIASVQFRVDFKITEQEERK